MLRECDPSSAVLPEVDPIGYFSRATILNESSNRQLGLDLQGLGCSRYHLIQVSFYQIVPHWQPLPCRRLVSPLVGTPKQESIKRSMVYCHFAYVCLRCVFEHSFMFFVGSITENGTEKFLVRCCVGSFRKLGCMAGSKPWYSALIAEVRSCLFLTANTH